MAQQIIKITDEIVGNFNKRYIFGLNLFPDDHPESGSLADPRLDFLRRICSNNRVSDITGSLYDFANFPRELFGNSNYRNSYETVRIGCYGGDFYDSNDWNLFLPLFFPQISQDFFDIERDPKQSEDKSLLFSIIYSDALAVFISPKTGDSATELQNLLIQPLTSISHFLESATNLFEIVLTTHADGDYFECHSQNIESFKLMDEPLTTVVADIEESIWYRENMANLTWDDECSMCLVPK